MATLTNSSYKPIIRPISLPNGPTWQTAALQTVGAIPTTFNYQDDVGLFGAENYFLKVDTNITESTLFLNSDAVINGYIDARINAEAAEKDEYYDSAAILDTLELDPGWASALITRDSDLPNKGPDSYISIDLDDVKSGNIYLDSWLDVRLYTNQREEHAYKKMYVRKKDTFYLGVHARNTRRLPYNIYLNVGKEYLTYDEIPTNERRFIMGNGR